MNCMRIEQEGDAGIKAFARMLEHAFAAVGRDDRQAHVLGVQHAVGVRMVHRARMECRDLVVVQVGGDEGLGGKAAGDGLDVGGGKAVAVQPLGVVGEVLADRCHDQRIAAEQLQVVGNVAGGAAEFAAHFRYQESDVENVDFFGQDMVLEPVLEQHDVVIGQRTADQDMHCFVLQSKKAHYPGARAQRQARHAA